MFRLWVRLFKDNHMLQDTVICNDEEDARTHKVMGSLEKACYELDLPKPIWLSVNVNDFKKTSKCRFTQDSFIEEVPFDYMEINVIEEDSTWF